MPVTFTAQTSLPYQDGIETEPADMSRAVKSLDLAEFATQFHLDICWG